jgi:hypothetical protein
MFRGRFSVPFSGRNWKVEEEEKVSGLVYTAFAVISPIMKSEVICSPETSIGFHKTA